MARSRGSGSVNDSASVRRHWGTVRVNKVNNLWWPGFVGGYTHTIYITVTRRANPSPQWRWGIASKLVYQPGLQRSSCLICSHQCKMYTHQFKSREHLIIWPNLMTESSREVVLSVCFLYLTWFKKFVDGGSGCFYSWLWHDGAADMQEEQTK